MSQILQFSLSNSSSQAKGEAVIYLGDDDQLNQLQLSITNLGAAIPLVGGQPLSEDAAMQVSTSLLYLSFSNLFPLNSPALANLSINAPGWKATYQSSGMVHNWCLAPTKNNIWDKNETLVISITGFQLTPNVMTGSLNTDYYNLQGVKDNSQQQSFSVANPPKDGNKNLFELLQPSWSNNGFNQLFITTDPGHPFKNKLSFYLNNESQEVIPIGEHTELALYFDYGQTPGYGALTSIRQANEIRISSPQQYGNHWTVRNPVGQFPVWSIQAEGQLMGKGPSGSMEIEIDKLISELEPGFCHLYFSWRNVPGYDDGTHSLAIQKLYPPTVQYFKCTPEAFTLNAADEKVPAMLSWQVDYSPNQVLIEDHGALPAVGQLPVEIGINDHQFTLTAIFGAGQFSVNQELKVPVSFAAPTATLASSSNLLDFTDANYNKFDIIWATERTKRVTFQGNLIPGIQPETGLAPLIWHSDQCKTLSKYGNLWGAELVMEALGLDGVTKIKRTLIFSREKLALKHPNIQALPEVVAENSLEKDKVPSQKVFAHFSRLAENEYQDLVLPLAYFTSHIIDWLNRAVNVWILWQQGGQVDFKELADEMNAWDFSDYKSGGANVREAIDELQQFLSKHKLIDKRSGMILAHSRYEQVRLFKIWKTLSATFPEVETMIPAFDKYEEARAVLQQLFTSDTAWEKAHRDEVNTAFQTIHDELVNANG